MHINISLGELEHLLEFAPVVLYKYVLFPEGKGRFLYISSGSSDVLGIKAERFIEDIDNFWNLVNEEDVNRLYEEDINANQQGSFFVSDIRFNNPAKGNIWIRLSSKPSNELFEGHEVWTGYMVDVTDSKLLEAELEERAKRDGMTQLWNKNEIVNSLGDELARFQRDNLPFSIMMMDLDYFKEINDQYGHLVGDDVLIQFTNIASAELREVDTLGRFGGEEFLAIIHNATREETLVIAERIKHATQNRVFEDGDNTFSITVSIGITDVKQQSPDSLEDIMKRADEALYLAKQNGRNKVEYK